MGSGRRKVKQTGNCVNASSGTLFLWSEDGTVMETGVQTSYWRDKPEHHTGQLGFGVHSLGTEGQRAGNDLRGDIRSEALAQGRHGIRY